MLRLMAGLLMATGVSVAVLSPGDARADLQSYVKICGGANSTAHEMVNFCRKAIETGRLNKRAEAQVYANLSIGYFELGQYLGAVDAANAALKADSTLVAALVSRAKANEQLQNLKDSIADYDRAIQLDRNAVDAFLGRGVLFLKNGNVYGSVEDLSRAITLDPKLGIARFNRGIAYLELGQPSRADADFSKLIGTNSRDAGAYLYRGQARAALKRADAIKDFDQAISLAGEWGFAWFTRGRYLDQRGDREGANANFLRAYELGHNDPWLIERVREISG